MKFLYLPRHLSHNDLFPYCEAYYILKTQSGAKITTLSTGTANRVSIKLSLVCSLDIPLIGGCKFGEPLSIVGIDGNTPA